MPREKTIEQIMDIADDPRVGVCWNSNAQDLQGQGLVHNFNLVKDRFGATVHIRELNVGDYPYQELMNLVVAIDYAGWILLEAGGQPKDRVKALADQRRIWEEMVAKAQEMTGRGNATIAGGNIEYWKQAFHKLGAIA